jgi:hypothetical protein
MRRRTKVLFAISAILFLSFLFFVTDRGQEILRGKIPADATGFQRDDIYMGAALFPWAYLLLPSFLLWVFGSISRWADRGPNRDQLDR